MLRFRPPRIRPCVTLSSVPVCSAVCVQIWGSYTFAALGPLLQDTQEHRANRARGPNTRFTSIIVPEMPRLTAQLQGLPDTMFQVTQPTDASPLRPLFS